MTTDEFVSAVVHRMEDNSLPEAEAMTAICEWVYGAFDQAMQIAGMAPDTPPAPVPVFLRSAEAQA